MTTLGPVIMNNSIDETGQLVKKVFARHTSKLGRDIWAMKWQYYRDRTKVPVTSIIKQYNKKDLRIIYSGKVITPKSEIKNPVDEQPME